MKTLNVKDNNTVYSIPLEPYTFIGEGVDSGQNERNPYFDFDNLPSGIYLCCNTDANRSNDYAAISIVIYGYDLSGDARIQSFTQSLTPLIGGEYPVFSMNESEPRRLYGLSLSWGATIRVWKINNLPSMPT